MEGCRVACCLDVLVGALARKAIYWNERLCACCTVQGRGRGRGGSTCRVVGITRSPTTKDSHGYASCARGPVRCCRAPDDGAREHDAAQARTVRRRPANTNVWGRFVGARIGGRGDRDELRVAREAGRGGVRSALVNMELSDGRTAINQTPPRLHWLAFDTTRRLARAARLRRASHARSTSSRHAMRCRPSRTSTRPSIAATPCWRSSSRRPCSAV